jgi:superfamily II DNA or RNA helicase
VPFWFFRVGVLRAALGLFDAANFGGHSPLPKTMFSPFTALRTFPAFPCVVSVPDLAVLIRLLFFTLPMSPVEFNERFLMDVGGWQAMKHARALLEMGRVVSFNYTPPILRGLVREGTTEYRAGLKIRNRSDVENLCSCRESREWGKICPHSLALGLAFLQPRESAPIKPTAPALITPKGPRLTVDRDHPVIIASFIIPPTFVSGWDRNQIMLGCEVESAGRRLLASALDRSKTFTCSSEDQQILERLREFSDGGLPGMVILSQEQFCRCLEWLVGHSRITLGKKDSIAVEREPIVPKLLVQELPDGRWKISSALPTAVATLIGPRSAWCWTGKKFQPIAPGLPSSYLSILREPVTLSTDQGNNFLIHELPGLRSFFQVDSVVGPAPVSPGVPEVFATFEGSLNYLNAKLQFLYGKRMITLGAFAPSENFVYESVEGKMSRNPRFERDCADVIHIAGFHGPDSNGDFTLKGQNAILRFFAQVLPDLQKKWKVSIGSRFANVTRNVERISPRFEIVSSGQDWFELSYSLESARGDRYSSAEIQRLLQSGQSATRLRDGALAIFNPDDIAEIEAVLRDCDPKQTKPGQYRIARSQAGFLDAAAREAGAQMVGDHGWQAWTAAQKQLKPLTPVSLGSLEEILRPYQKEGVYWLHFLHQNQLGGILADEMGLGKTLQILAYLRAANAPSLVVCPASLLFNWQREAERFAPELKVLSIDGSDRGSRFSLIPKHDMVLTSYPLLRRDIDSYRPFHFGAIILDEATHIKNPDTLNAQAATALRGEQRFVLTGTPVENSVRDLWSIMNFVLPGYLGSREEFRERYELPIGRGSEPERQRLAKRLRPVMLRRLKKDVLRDLPEKLEQTAFCDLSDEQRELYAKLQMEGRKKLDLLAKEKGSNRARMTMLTTLLRLRQACCDLRLLGQEPAARSGKLDLLLELLEEAIDGGHRVLIFSQFVTMLNLVRQELDSLDTPYCYLDGSTKDRGAVVDRFQNQSDIPVFLISLKAGGVGLNLAAADTVFHFDPWWNPAVEDQATDRAHRIGQERVVTSYKLITRGTVEEKILALQNKKREVIDATVESEEPLMTGLTVEEISDLLETM